MEGSAMQPQPEQPLIDVRGLVKKYGDFAAVTEISLQVRPGEVFVLLGPNGAGKTTTIRMLMGILQPTAGRASIAGLDCFADRAEVMRHVGYLPDEPIFYDFLRGREIVHFVGEMHGLSCRETDEHTVGLIEQLDLADAMEEYAVNYSRGMKKKLALVCAMFHEPRLLIMDEPTNGLDPLTTRRLHGIIRAHAEAGKSVFLSTHLLDQAEKLCDRVGILYRGRLAAMGQLAELRGQASADSTLEEIFFAVTAPDTERAGSAPAVEPGPDAPPAAKEPDA
jgi:ABC-2 type transport system ATP-binding protein